MAEFLLYLLLWLVNVDVVSGVLGLFLSRAGEELLQDHRCGFPVVVFLCALQIDYLSLPTTCNVTTAVIIIGLVLIKESSVVGQC